MTRRLMAVCGVLCVLGLLSVRVNPARPLNGDEQVIVWVVSGDLGTMLARNANANSAPPLYGLAIWGWQQLGFAGASLRWVSWLAYWPTLALVYAILRRRVGHRWALAGMTLFGINLMMMEYALMLREYSWSACLVLAFWRLFERLQNTWRDILAILTLATLCLWTQYGFVFVVGMAWLGVWPQVDKQKWLVGGNFLAVQVAMIYGLVTRHQLYVSQADYLAGYMGALNLLGGTVNLLVILGNGAGFIGFGVLLYYGWRGLAASECLLLGGVWVAIMAASLVGIYPYGGIRQVMPLLAMLVLVACLGLQPLYARKPRLFAVSVGLWAVSAVMMMLSGLTWLVG